MSAEGFGSGKLILCGEHSVVYGQPAIAFAVNLGTTVRLSPTSGPIEVTTSGPCDDALLRAVEAALGDEGARVQLESTLPIGRGMGSSAALSVALVRAVAARSGEPPPSADEAFTRALPLERIFHRNPSGLDVAIAARGGVIRYRRGPPAELVPLETPSWSVVVLDTGDVGNTADLVAGVGARRPAIDPTLERMGQLVRLAEQSLHDPEILGEILDENHDCLREIGVSNQKLDDLVALARAHGAYGAKLSGAGGGGVVLALAKDEAQLLAAAQRSGITAWSCRPLDAP